VHYSDDLMKELIPAIKDRSLPAVDRLGIQNDLFNMVGMVFHGDCLIVSVILIEFTINVNPFNVPCNVLE